jgi:hypothetical protein
MEKVFKRFKTILLLPLLTVMLYSSCKDNNNPVEPAAATNYSGIYQNLKYDDNTLQPVVTLSLIQKDALLTGTGTYNGINFSFTGALIQTHLVISFDLLNTNMGDFRNCTIDAYFGANNYLCGGYTLSTQFGTEKIRFQQVKNSQ